MDFRVYPKTLGNGYAWVILPPSCHIFLSYIMGFDIKMIHHVDIIAMMTLCYSMMSHGTRVLCCHISMLTLHTFLMSRALWLPHV